MTQSASSPASSGPAGSHFEGQIGAFYLLSLLIGSEPRGLRDTAIDTVEFQRAGEDRPLDDVIVCARDSAGHPAVLEIQVKRKITFTPNDALFCKVMGQIVKAIGRDDFWTSRYELAVAIARSSRKIDGPYQDVLTWAREINDAATFADAITRPGSANDDMRTFVQTFRSHLRHFGEADDDKTVWRLLRRFQILTFDFTAEGSASEALVRERATVALHPDDARCAGDLWNSLVELAISAAASGGDRNRDALIRDPKLRSFRFSGNRRLATVRAALAEASKAALADIGNRIGEVMLTRHELMARVRAALDDARYVEIRGDAGVGKSGLLKHAAQQLSTEATVVVLSPGRTTRRGWIEMRAVLGFDGTARELLSDLAGNGGATLFLDSLDFFTDEERLTVIDLVRAAAEVPGFSIVATMRRNFGVDEPNWLPTQSLNSLGRADPIVIEELTDTEVEEIRHSAPRLAPILSDTHPARAVVRNPFRLARIAAQRTDDPTPRTEVEMARQWWRSADGRSDAGHRERARLLKALAIQATISDGPMDTSKHPPQAVDALIKSETLRDLGQDRVTFYHDALREWAIANLLHAEPERLDALPMEQPASAAFRRGVELAARMALEGQSDPTSWQAMLAKLGGDRVHGSWRQAALLALVRSEMGAELLDRASELLLANHAELLSELIRLVIAVEVKPASRVYASSRLDPADIPANLDVPIGPAWRRLIVWLLKPGTHVPPAAIPDVIDLYMTWSVGLLGRDSLTPELVRWFYHWLREIESNHDLRSRSDRRPLFDGVIDAEQIRSLESRLRNGFFRFSNQAPELARQYLNSLGKGARNENALIAICTFRGRLAAAAPAELAELIGTALIQVEDGSSYHHRDPFTFLDDYFSPSSRDPRDQGLFFELLDKAPQHGLSLIRRLVDHAIAFLRAENDSLTIAFPSGDRDFTWTQSFTWSRGAADNNSVPSALMALKSWGDQRIESGESVEAVLDDIIGPLNTHAAYLSIAIDLIMSHWPKSRAAAVPYIASPELLCIDRHTCEVINNVIKATHSGAVSPVPLNKHAAQRHPLDQLLGQYTISDASELCDTLVRLLTQAKERLGPPQADSNFYDPAFMVVYALNVLDPENWEEVTQGPDGQPEAARQYVRPDSEYRHLAALQSQPERGLSHLKMQCDIDAALDDPARSSQEFAASAVEWAQKEPPTPLPDQSDERRMQEQAVFGAAMIAMRDGTDELRTQYADWAHKVFAEALQAEDNPVPGIWTGLCYNPIAIAFAGMLFALRVRSNPDDIRQVLDIAARDSAAAAHGLGAAIASLLTIDERLPQSILRCAFAACIRPRHARRLPDEERARRAERVRSRVKAAVDREMVWLTQDGPEPAWPEFPAPGVRRRRVTRPPGGMSLGNRQEISPSEYANEQSAANWLGNVSRTIDASQHPWLLKLVSMYADWTAEANGAGLNTGAEIETAPDKWNEAYYHLVARCLPCLDSQEIRELVLERICALPDQAFFDVIALFVPGVDEVYFNKFNLDEGIAVDVRAALAERMAASSGWRLLLGKREASIESHIDPAIAALFFNHYELTQQHGCYLRPEGIERVAPFLPILETLTKTGASIFVAHLTLNLLEVSMRTEHIPFLLAAVHEWLRHYSGDTKFWVEYRIGRRVSACLEAAYQEHPDLFKPGDSARTAVDHILTAFVQMGIADARRLEEALESVHW